MINKNKWKLAKIMKIYPLNIHKRSQKSYFKKIKWECDNLIYRKMKKI